MVNQQFPPYAASPAVVDQIIEPVTVKVLEQDPAERSIALDD